MIKKDNKGFTIIEVVLVLAIAGLIFAMVFIALPAMNRGQRDTSRKNDANTVVAALNTYRGNNKSSFTGLTEDKLQKHIDSLNQYDKQDVKIDGVAGTTDGIAAVMSQVKVRTGVKCPVSMPEPGNTTVVPITTGASSRSAIVVILLENNGSQTQAFCQDL